MILRIGKSILAEKSQFSEIYIKPVCLSNGQTGGKTIMVDDADLQDLNLLAALVTFSTEVFCTLEGLL